MTITEDSRRQAADCSALMLMCMKHNLEFTPDNCAKLASSRFDELIHVAGLVYSKTAHIGDDSNQDEITAAIKAAAEAYGAEF